MNRRHLLGRMPAFVLAAITLFMSYPGGLPAADRMKGPVVRPAAFSVSDEPTSLPAWFGWNAILLYSKLISPADGPRSPSYPTGTAYARDAVKKHGFLLGTILTADRLIHEADIYRGPRITRYGVSRYYDPVEYNTYWWDETVDCRDGDSN